MRELPSVQGQYMERVGDSALISIGRNSLVYFDKVDGKTVVAKSYSPSRNSTYDRRYAGCRKHPLLGLFASDSERLHMFRAEAALMMRPFLFLKSEIKKRNICAGPNISKPSFIVPAGSLQTFFLYPSPVDE